MRTACLATFALFAAAASALAQPPGAAPVKADPKLDPYLEAWEKKTADVKSMAAEITLKRTDAVFKKDTNYKGSIVCMKPNFAVLRLDNADDKTKIDYEAYICDGKKVYAYNGVQKSIIKYTIPQGQAGVDNLMLDFMAGMKAKDVKERFDVTLSHTDENYVYISVKPRRPADQREFQTLQLALYGPGGKAAAFAYLPAQVNLTKPGGDVEVWRFISPRTDVKVQVTDFKFVPIPGWDEKDAPSAPMGGSRPAGKP